jgi:terminase large subunit-like protein
MSSSTATRKPRRPIAFAEAFRDPNLFGQWFADPTPESWAAWLVVGKAIFAEPMTPEELALYRRWTGRATPPAEQVSEFVGVIGRRGGKDWASAAFAVYIACLRPPRLKRGELGRVMCLACDRDQAGETFRYISSLIDGTPLLAQMVESRTKDSIDLRNGIQITVQTASFRRVRGRKVVAAIASELAFWIDTETSQNPADAVLTAIRPSMLGVEGALLICISSPYAKRGPLWQAVNDHYGREEADVLVWKAPTIAMHPTADRAFLQREERKDPVAFRSEYGTSDGIDFRSDLEAFVSVETVDACTIKGRSHLPFEPHYSYRAFIDVAGGSGGDSCALAIARREGERSVVCRIVEWRPPFDPTVVAREVVQILSEYRLASVRGDRYSGGTWASIVKAAGASYEYEDRTKSDVFHDALVLLNSRRVELPHHQRTINQLLALERTTSKLGKDTISHPPGGSDDCANAVCGAVLMVQRKRMFEDLVMVSDRRPGRTEAQAIGPGVDEAERVRADREARERPQHNSRAWRCTNGTCRREFRGANPVCPVDGAVAEPIAAIADPAAGMGTWWCRRCRSAFQGPVDGAACPRCRTVGVSAAEARRAEAEKNARERLGREAEARAGDIRRRSQRWRCMNDGCRLVFAGERSICPACRCAAERLDER